MKTIRLSLLAAALVGTAALLTAGPSYLPGRPAPKNSGPAKPAIVKPATETPAPACATCACCKKAS